MLPTPEEFGPGWSFNQPIDIAVWPVSLNVLNLTGSFDHRVDNVMWPASVKRMSFYGSFNQPVDNVAWPPVLETLSFERCFNQPIWGRQRGRLPSSICFATVSGAKKARAINQSLTRCGRRRLRFIYHFRRAARCRKEGGFKGLLRRSKLLWFAHTALVEVCVLDPSRSLGEAVFAVFLFWSMNQRRPGGGKIRDGSPESKLDTS